MTVQDLREALALLPDDMPVYIPLHPDQGFTGHFFTPCIEESDVIEMARDEEGTDQEKAFILAPHGFTAERTGPPPELN